MFTHVAGIGLYEPFVDGRTKHGDAVIRVAVNPVHHAGQGPLDAFDNGSFAEGAKAVGGVSVLFGLGHREAFPN
jgi:hypothetical protein